MDWRYCPSDSWHSPRLSRQRALWDRDRHSHGGGHRFESDSAYQKRRYLRGQQSHYSGLSRSPHSLAGYQCAIDRLRGILTVIVAASLSTEPHGPVTLAQNCVVCVSTGLVMASPDPTGAEVLPDAPWNHVTETFGSLTLTINLTVVPAATC